MLREAGDYSHMILLWWGGVRVHNKACVQVRVKGEASGIRTNIALSTGAVRSQLKGFLCKIFSGKDSSNFGITISYVCKREINLVSSSKIDDARFFIC